MDKSYKLIVIFALLVHIVYLAIFLRYGIKALWLYNLGSVIFYIIMELLVIRRNYKVATILVHMEIELFVVFNVIMIGWDFGFQAILVALSALVYFNPFTVK